MLTEIHPQHSEINGTGRDHSAELLNAYNPKIQGVRVPFDHDFASARRITRFDSSTPDKKPVDVAVGGMAIAPSDRELYTSGLFGCAALFVKGKDQVHLAHLVAGNDPNNLGYWGDKFYNPIADTVERISSAIDEAEGHKTNEAVAVLVVNSETPGQEERVGELVAALESKTGMKIKTVPVSNENTLVYFNPQSPDKLLVVGTKTGDKATHNGVVEQTEITIGKA